jgi:hypothetical protein
MLAEEYKAQFQRRPLADLRSCTRPTSVMRHSWRLLLVSTIGLRGGCWLASASGQEPNAYPGKKTTSFGGF